MMMSSGGYRCNPNASFLTTRLKSMLHSSMYLRTASKGSRIAPWSTIRLFTEGHYTIVVPRTTSLCRKAKSRQTTTKMSFSSKTVPSFAVASRIPVMLGRQRSFVRDWPTKKTGVFRRRTSTMATAKTSKETSAPSLQTLRWVAFTTGLPFVGFGFMDNAILVIAGDAIDNTLGVTLGISTMCAAAIGNIISDLAGIGCAASIEEFCATTLNLPVPKLTSAQRQLRSVRMASQSGMAIGMTIGCLLGMLPLLFIDSSKAERLKEKVRLERLCLDVLNGAKLLVGAESTCLYLRVDKQRETVKKSSPHQLLPDYYPSVEGEYLYAMYYVEPQNNGSYDQVHGGNSPTNKAYNVHLSSQGDDHKHVEDSASSDDRANEKDIIEESLSVSPSESKNSHMHTVSTSRVVPVGKGFVSRAVLTGTTWNIAGNLMDEPDFYPLSIETGRITSDCTAADHDHFRDCAVVPILDSRGRVIAVLEAFNKERSHKSVSEKLGIGGFTDQDVETLVNLASHVSVSLQKVYQDGSEEHEDMGLENTIRILQESKGIKRLNSRSEMSDITTTSRDSSNVANRERDAPDSDVNSARSNTVKQKRIKLFPD